MRSRGFWIAFLIVLIPVVVGMVVASIWFNQPGSVRQWQGAYVYLGTLSWFALSLVTAIACSIWVKGKVTLGLWIGLVIAAIILFIIFGIGTGLFHWLFTDFPVIFNC